VPIRKKNS
jgi:hypothetical protein